MPDDRYHPRPGVHVCGIDELQDCFVTIANYGPAARANFAHAKAEIASAPNDPFDMVVDLVDDSGDTVEDFHITRQMLHRLENILRAKSLT